MSRNLPISFRRWVTTAVVIGSALAPFRPAYAWGPDGHRIVCAIAWDEMRPKAQARVFEVLRITSRQEFAELCNWADRYRASHKETGSWHFVNVPPDAKQVALDRDCGEPASCVVNQITRDVQTLKSGRGDVNIALKFLMHFVGDVHQPLHVSFEDDRGGNDITGTYFKKKTNLHAVWDNGMLKQTGQRWDEIAAEIESTITPAKRKAWSWSTPLEWANESLAITRSSGTNYLKHSDVFRLGQAYQDRNYPIVQNQLARGGVRLGQTLNDIFDPQLRE